MDNTEHQHVKIIERIINERAKEEITLSKAQAGDKEEQTL